MQRHPAPALSQLNLVVKDVDATLLFYRRLGLKIDAEPGAQHVAVQFPGGILVEFDSTAFVPQWNSGWRGSTGGSTILGFWVPSRDDVDKIHADLTSAGYSSHQQPYDAFWGGRYAIIDDPDGNGVGLMSPADQQRSIWPPTRPPPAS